MNENNTNKQQENERNNNQLIHRTVVDPGEIFRLNPISGISVELFKMISEEEFDSDEVELIITGVPTNKDGKLRWSRVEELVSDPYTHGLLDAISTISHIIRTIDHYRTMLEKNMPSLKVRFVSKITDTFVPDQEHRNPIAWIHLGHGIKEFTYKEVGGLEDWEEPEYESVPGLSNGNEESDFLSAEWIRDTISMMKGKILFTALPLCYSFQIGSVLSNSDNLCCIHAPYKFSVPSTLEFYDCNDERVLPDHTLTAWAKWVRLFEQHSRDATIKLIKEKSGIFNINQNSNLEAIE